MLDDGVNDEKDHQNPRIRTTADQVTAPEDSIGPIFVIRRSSVGEGKGQVEKAASNKRKIGLR